MIDEDLLAQVEKEGHIQINPDEIIYPRRDDYYIFKGQGTFTTDSGLLRKKRITRGWDLCTQWKYSSTNWVELKDLKEYKPIYLTQYAVGITIYNEPKFIVGLPLCRIRVPILRRIQNKSNFKEHTGMVFGSPSM